MDISLITLVVTPFIAAILAVPWIALRIKIVETIIALAAVVQLGLALALAYRVSLDGPLFAFRGFLYFDALGAYFALALALVAFFAGMYSIGYLRAEVEKGIIGARRVRQYFALFSLFVFAMLLALSAASPIVMWIAIEGTTLSTAFLVSFYNKPSATEAAWKYLVLNSLGLLLGFLGTLLFLVLPESGGSTWESLKSAAHSFDPLMVKIAFVFILVGYGTKVGFIPLHTWLPDAHSKAPVPVSALLSGLLLNVALIAIVRFRAVVDVAVDPAFTKNLLLFFGVASLLVAALIIFIQRNYKRLLAYSSIEHMGILALGFAFGGIGVAAALLHMLYHALLKTLLFIASGNVFLAYSSTKIRLVSGMLRALPVTSVVFMLGVMAAVGLPPFGTFGTKVSILASGIAEYPYLTALALVALVIAFVGFLKHISAMLFGEAPEGIQIGERKGLTLLMPAILAGLIVGISFYTPEFVTRLIESIAHDFSISPL